MLNFWPGARSIALFLLPAGGAVHAEPPPVPPPAIVLHIVTSYQGKAPISLHDMPFVYRLRSAFRRADLPNDYLFELPVEGLQSIRVTSDSFLERRIVDLKKRTIEIEFKRTGNMQRMIFDFDRTSGEWLITDIRDQRGGGLRQLLQIRP